MYLRTGLKALAACSALFLCAQLAPAQTKAAVVSLQKAVFETDEIKKADADMQAKYKSRADQLQQLQADIQRIQQQLQSGAGKMTPQAEADLNAEGTRKQRDGQRLQEDLQADIERDRNEILSKASQKMVEVVKKLAEEKGLDLVVDSSTNVALYFKPALDITNDAVAAYNKAYPAAAPASAKK